MYSKRAVGEADPKILELAKMLEFQVLQNRLYSNYTSATNLQYQFSLETNVIHIKQTNIQFDHTGNKVLKYRL